MLEECRYRSNVTACAIKFMIITGRGRLIYPPLSTVSHDSNRSVPLIMVTVNQMDKWIVCADMIQPLRQIEPPIDLLAQSA